MYMPETLARERSSDLYEQARHRRAARQSAELRKLDRASKRAERKLLRAWRRADELRATLETSG